MQKVTYVNAYGESIEFAAEPPVLLRSVSGFSHADAQIVSAQGAYQAGSTVQRLQLQARSVQVQFDILPQESREAFYRERMRVEQVLSVGRCMRDGKMGCLIYENDAGAWRTDAVVDGGIHYGKRFLHAAAGSRVSFLCPSPYLLSCEEQVSQMRMGQSGLTLPLSLPVMLGMRRFRTVLANSGTADAPVTLTLYGAGELPRLVNHTTGAELIVGRAIPSGAKLVVHTDPQALSCVLYGADGAGEDAFGYLDPSVAVSAFVLVPGDNDVEYAPGEISADSRVDIAWRSCYEGV